MRTLEHPRKQEIEQVRNAIQKVRPDIEEEIKWNAPSFRTSDTFATVNLRSLDTLQLILHFGAKVKRMPDTPFEIEAPEGMTKWLGSDRCLVTLGSGQAFESSLDELRHIVRSWTERLDEITRLNDTS